MKPGPEHVGMTFRTSPHSGGAVLLGLHEDGGVTMAYRLPGGLGQPFKVPPGRFESDGWDLVSARSEQIIDAAVALHGKALVMMGKIDVPTTTEESLLYDACRDVVFRAQRLLRALGIRPSAYLLEPGESLPGTEER